MQMDDAELERRLAEILAGCPHGEGCEDSCPADVIRWQRDPLETLKRLAYHSRVDVYQAHLLCRRSRDAHGE